VLQNTTEIFNLKTHMFSSLHDFCIVWLIWPV